VVSSSVTMIPYWAKVGHEDVWTHSHPWYALEHAVDSWMVPRITRIIGKTVGEMTEEFLESLGWMSVVGGLMIAAGILILIPGPVDAFVFSAGFVAGAWVGGFAAVVIYNLLGVLLVLGGMAMIYFD